MAEEPKKSNEKSKFPDLNEAVGMVSKLAKDFTKSVKEIVSDYKSSREEAGVEGEKTEEKAKAAKADVPPAQTEKKEASAKEIPAAEEVSKTEEPAEKAVEKAEEQKKEG